MRNGLLLTLALGVAGAGCNLILGNDEHTLETDAGDSSMMSDDSAAAVDASSGDLDETLDVDAGALQDARASGDARSSQGAGSEGGIGEKFAKGAACASGAACAAGLYCADGVCCDQACSGSCEACNLPMFIGTCSPVLEGQPPSMGHGACADAGASACGEDSKCDGKGSCELWPNGKSCGGASCTTATNELVSGSACDGMGACKPTEVTCAPFKCATTGTACSKTCASNTDCVGQPCVNGSCGTVVNGSMCTSAAQCTSGNCVDGYCCNSACSGACQACDVAGVQGTCTTVASGQPHGTRAACAGSGTCQGSCTGGTSCAYPTAQCAVQSCSGSAEKAASSCNGAGSCNAQTSTNCPGDFACNGSSCFTSCSSDSQCASGCCNSSGGCVAQTRNACGGCGTLTGTGPIGASCGVCGSYACSANKLSIVCNDPNTTGSCPATWCTTESPPSGVSASNFQCVDFDNGMPSSTTWVQKLVGSGTFSRSTATDESTPDSLAVSVQGSTDTASLTWSDVGSSVVQSVTVTLGIYPNPPAANPPQSSNVIDLVCIQIGADKSCLYYTVDGLDDFNNTSFTGYSAHSAGGNGGCDLGTTLNSNTWNTVVLEVSSDGVIEITMNGVVATACTGVSWSSATAVVTVGADPGGTTPAFGWSGYFDNIIVARQ